MKENTKVQTYFIENEISPAYQNEILSFIEDNYLKIRPEYFQNIIKKEDKISFLIQDPVKKYMVETIIKPGNPVEIRLISDEKTPEDFAQKVKDDMYFIVHAYEENILNSTLYFSWIEGEKIIPEKPPTSRKRAANRLFSSNLLLLYIGFFIFNVVLFIFIGLYAVIVILASQFLIVLYADKILARQSDWRITPENPYVHILEYQLPLDEFKQFQEKFGEETVLQMKKEVYDRTLAQKTYPTCEIGDEVLEKYGFHCNPLNSVSKVVNVYEIVKKAADSFDLPTPKIVISNTMVPNAAATGPSPSRGLVLITTGLLVHLDEEEILTVVGHEMGHLQGRDPLILFSIITGEFILRFTLLLPIVIRSPLIYLIFVFALIFFVAKFFETRADLLSAIKIGKPEVLAEALRKIAFKKLQLERVSRSRIPGWLAWDPHPPIYFRIDRLENMKTPVEAKNPLIQSVKDVFNGFIAAFR